MAAHRTSARIGRCIYCGDTPKKLQREHIIPLALHGEYVLNDASCVSCARITSKFEGVMTQGPSGPLYPARRVLNLRSRRKKKQNPKIPLEVSVGSASELRNLLVAEHCGPAVLPIIGSAGFSTGADPNAALKMKGTYVAWYGESPDAVWTAQKADRITLYAGVYPLPDFARMIAKIAYSYAVLQFGIERMIGASVVDAIMGRTDSLSYWVGSTDQEVPGGTPDELHRIAAIRSPQDGIFGLVQLFSMQSAPGYTVVVDLPSRWKAVQAAHQVLQAGSSQSL